MVAKVVELSDELTLQLAELARQTGRNEADLLHAAIATYVGACLVPRPRSDGAIDDLGVAGCDIDEWMTENRRQV